MNVARKVSSLHDDLLWPCVTHACGMGEYIGSGKRAAVDDHSPLVRAAQFGVAVGHFAPPYPQGETAYEPYCAAVASSIGERYETVVAAIYDRYFTVETGADGLSPTREERERGVQEDLSRTLSLIDCGGLRLIRTASDFAASATNVVLAVEGMDFVDREAQVLSLLEAGIRVFALQYNKPNALSWGNCGDADCRAGLTDLGRRVAAQVFASGAIIDLAHTAPGGRKELLDFAEEDGYGPQLAYTHGAIFQDASPELAARIPGRFLQVDEARRLLRMGGVIGLTPARSFCGTLAQFASRVARLRAENPGPGAVVLGTDFGGLWEGMLLPEVQSVTDLARIGNALAADHGLTDAEIDAFLRTNATSWLRRALTCAPGE